jgi:hypothetical protein
MIAVRRPLEHCLMSAASTPCTSPEAVWLLMRFAQTVILRSGANWNVKLPGRRVG